MVIYGALALAGPLQAEMSLSEGRAGTSRHSHCSDPARIVSYTWEMTLPTLAERILHFRFTLVGLVIYAGPPRVDLRITTEIVFQLSKD